MSPAGTATGRIAGSAGGGRLATALAGAGILSGLTLVLLPSVPAGLGILVAAVGVLAALALLLPAGVRALVRAPGLAVVIVLAVLATLWVITGLRRAGHLPDGLSTGTRAISGIPYPYVVEPYNITYRIFDAGAGWPWQIGRISLLPLVAVLLSAAGGLVLLADSVRVQLGLEPRAMRQRAPWRVMTAPDGQSAPGPWRMVTGALLILFAAFLAIGLADRYVAGDALLQALALLGVGGWTAVLIGGPFLVGALMRLDLDKAGRAREEERQRFAAHLHDSVLQTLALVQRQAHDPAAVVRLARRQEHALRAWMAGESELASETLAAALREIVAEVEDEYRMTVELTAIGDRPLDGKGEALVAAAREALRNAGRHAPGVPVTMFCEIARDRAEVFVRDEGPGFVPSEVASERRGIRDAMIGRMAVSGGRATIDSTPGEGTEVALMLGPPGASR
jgi:signal transduction histidine kinase